ncbi:MAG TPA: DUF1501 domain-containing protein [Thermoanaerobaculia bacterium]|nr:DUF1501 domain-containing protein [Thermoanaerobaculia bacterium]
MSSCSCQITRRGFVMGCSAAIAALSGSRFNSLAFASPDGSNNETLVVLFLRGGQDGLNVVVPSGGNDRGFYQSLRPGLQVPVASVQPYNLGSVVGPNGQTAFGLHPAAAPLYPLFQDGKLAVIQAVGMSANERSHFDSMNWMELGTPGVSNTSSGWLTRHLQTAGNLPSGILVPSLAVGGLQPLSQLGSDETINMGSPGDFSLDIGPWRYRDLQRVTLRNLYESDTSWLHQAGLQALDAVDIIELYASGGYTPRPGVSYPDTWFGQNLQTIAQLVKLDVGLRVATVDLGGWDTHENQGNGSGGYFSGLLGELCGGLAALYEDLDEGSPPHTSKLTVVVMSEFGRRAYENSAQGCDHGHGNNMFVLSGNAIGGLHGSWPGLAQGQLNEGDLEVTTDFRRVLSEILIRRLGNPALSAIFPGYSGYSPLGVVQGPDLPVDAQPIFSDGFESGDLSAWSTVVG